MTILAVSGLVAEVLYLTLPFLGQSLLTALVGPFPLRVDIANTISLFAVVASIALGIAVDRRGRSATAGGIFIGVAAVLGLRTIAQFLTSVGESVRWQGWVSLGLEATACVFLFLAAGAADREERMHQS